MVHLRSLLGILCVFTGLVFAQEPSETSPPAPSGDSSEAQAETKPHENPPEATVPPEQSRGTGQNLLGQQDTARGEGRRNENIQINLVDNNAARDATGRLGTTATIIEEFRVERS